MLPILKINMNIEKETIKLKIKLTDKEILLMNKNIENIKN